MPELSIKLSKTAQGSEGRPFSQIDVGVGRNTPSISALRPTGHPESGSE